MTTDTTETGKSTTAASASRSRATPHKAPRKASRAAGGTKGGSKPRAAKTAAVKPARRLAKVGRAESKQAKLIAMLQITEGATVEEVAKAFGWQPHTVRGAIAGALKKKLGLDVTSEKVDGRGRVYRITD
jgi:hypothetical protein